MLIVGSSLIRAVEVIYIFGLQVDLQFLVLGEGVMRETARQQARNIEDLYKSQMA